MKNTTLCYIQREGQYLMLHRVKKKNDVNQDKWVGIGGKFEDKESPEDCLLREVFEETGLTLTDDLGGYEFNGTTIYPLTYEAGSAALFVNGAPQPAPAVTAGPPLVFTGITVPAGSDAVLIYKARANDFADPATGGTIVNTVTITGNSINTPITATETVTVATAPALTISKAISPTQVVDNDRVTYTFLIQNSGTTPVVATDNAVVTDTFDPVLSNLIVAFNGTAWTQGVQYNYSETTGLFATVPGQILVPAATYTQEPVTGAYTATPGIATLVVTGTI